MISLVPSATLILLCHTSWHSWILEIGTWTSLGGPFFCPQLFMRPLYCILYSSHKHAPCWNQAEFCIDCQHHCIFPSLCLSLLTTSSQQIPFPFAQLPCPSTTSLHFASHMELFPFQTAHLVLFYLFFFYLPLEFYYMDVYKIANRRLTYRKRNCIQFILILTYLQFISYSWIILFVFVFSSHWDCNLFETRTMFHTFLAWFPSSSYILRR